MNRLLTRFLSCPLFWQLLSILLSAIALSQALSVVFVLLDRSALRTESAVATWTGRIADTMALLEALPADTRGQLLREFNQPGLHASSAQAGNPPATREAIDTLRPQLVRRFHRVMKYNAFIWIKPSDFAQPAVLLTGVHDPVGGDKAGNGSLYDIAVFLKDRRMIVFRVAAPAFPPPFSPRLLWNSAIALVMLIVAAYVMARVVTNPLSRLAAAAEALGRGSAGALAPEAGASELRHAARAFNAMQDRLHRYLDSRTRVLAAISHDLRTPLTRLRLRAESIDDREIREKMIRDFGEMESMIAQALGLFAGRNGGEPYTSVDFNVLLTKLRDHYAEIGACVTFDGSASEPLLCQSQCVRRILTNLIDNALRFGECVYVWIEDGEALMIRIRDGGPGIPESDLERVFEPFYRGEPSRNRGSGGTGLGLTIARELAEAQGGTVRLANLAGGGLESLIVLPRRESHIGPPPGRPAIADAML